MILVYVDNKRFGEVRDLPFEGQVSYRNPRYFKEVEKCKGVYVHGDYPKIKEAYKGKLITVDDDKDSTDYTIAELREMKSTMTDYEWRKFTQHDDRKSIDSI